MEWYEQEWIEERVILEKRNVDPWEVARTYFEALCRLKQGILEEGWGPEDVCSEVDSAINEAEVIRVLIV